MGSSTPGTLAAAKRASGISSDWVRPSSRPATSRQIALDQRREAGLDLAFHRPAFDARGVVQPLVAATEHRDQQLLEPAGVVVHESQRLGDHLGIRRAGFDHFQRPPRRRRVVRVGILGDARLGAEAAEVGHLAGEAGAQRIERRDAQAAGVAEQSPAAFGIVGQHLTGQPEGELLVRLLRHLAARRALQTAENAVAHLGRRLVGEGQRQHFFRMVNHGQQAQEALRQ